VLVIFFKILAVLVLFAFLAFIREKADSLKCFPALRAVWITLFFVGCAEIVWVTLC